MDEELLQVLYPQRKYPRLKTYNYASAGAYFVTICTQNKLCLFGDIEDGLMAMNPFGEIVTSAWKEIPVHYPEVGNEIFIVMPNHVHGIIWIEEI